MDRIGYCGVHDKLTRSSSKTPFRILSRISLVAVSKAISTLAPDFALVSTNKRPSSFAHISASSVGTCRTRWPGPGCAPSGTSVHKSTLFPTRIQVRWGSACSLTSFSHERAFAKPGLGIQQAGTTGKACERKEAEAESTGGGAGEPWDQHENV